VTIKATSMADPTAFDTAQIVLKGEYSLLTNQVPYYVNVSDGVPYELGMKFFAQVSGSITAIRYMKAASDPGPHTGNIWSASGGLLASVTFTNESASGWQVARLATPLHINVNTIYVVSVNTTGAFDVTPDFFVSPIVNGSLVGVSDGHNGVAAAPGQFPFGSWHNSNYFRDILFVPDP
jgi:hypothetical protein